jgi:excisionase family DNA binding protein
MKTNATTARSDDGHDLPVLMNIAQVAEHLGVSVRHVRRLVSERRIPYVKWGHLLRFDPRAIGKWINSQETPAWSR